VIKQKFSSLRSTSHSVNNLGTAHRCLVFSGEKSQSIISLECYTGMISSTRQCYQQTKNISTWNENKQDCETTQFAHKTNFKNSCTF